MAGGSRTCRKWRTWLSIKHAPLDWLMDLNRKPLRLLWIVLAASVGFQSVQSALQSSDEGLRTYAWIAMGSIVPGCLVVAVFLGKRRVNNAALEVALVVGAYMLLNASLSSISVKFVSNVLWLSRTHAISVVLWKTFPVVFGFPILPAAIILAFAVVVDITTWEMAQIDMGSRLRVHLTSCTSFVGFLIMSLMSSSRLCSIFDAQQALAAEKSLMESIITMMCDATVWLSENGSVIIRADERFTAILGRNAAGEDLLQALAVEEQQRLQECLSRAEAGPVLLPTTLVTENGVQIQVEMFIVGNRDASAASSADVVPAFLIGVQIASKQGTETFRDARLTQEHASMLASMRRDLAQPMSEEDLPDELLPGHSSPDGCSSMPTTTATGDIFNRVDAGASDIALEVRADAYRQNLQSIIALGRQERWLLSREDVQTRRGQFIGSGSFGQICGGQLYGSPIAVKTAKHLADVSSVKQLLSIVNEIRILRHVRHPNVVLFHGACIEIATGNAMLVMERVDGEDLCEYVVTQSADCGARNRLQLLLDIACALWYLHAQSPQVAHGDLKAANIIVESAIPRAKLLDFGLSRLLTKNARPLGGSLAWAAPELILSPNTKPKASADVFSFGRLAYLLVACEKPLEGMSRRTIMEMVKNRIPHELRWEEEKPLHPECRRMCERVLSLDPEARPAMADVHREASSWKLSPGAERSAASTGELAGAAAAAADLGGGRAGSARFFGKLLNAPPFRREQPQPQPQQRGPQGPPPAPPAPAAADEQEPAQAPREPTLALPEFGRTQQHVRLLMASEVLLHWNSSVAPGMCCKYHAAVAELAAAAESLMGDACLQTWTPYNACQCHLCGALDKRQRRTCAGCGEQFHRPLGLLPNIQEETCAPVAASAPRPKTMCSL